MKTIIVKWLKKFSGAHHKGDIGYIAELDEATAKKWIANKDVEKATEKELKDFEEKLLEIADQKEEIARKNEAERLKKQGKKQTAIDAASGIKPADKS